eukprot:TRINITY_DN22618_c0_g1_i1.p1 TRINITY_DN22618_c0_g1~~TRINITY_DN22618_c0_g1_i1.p1  ORF type:complete len:1574 (+),score=385.00 TRINITY_DN22618_c0_g1_i1:175-4722(+)
MSSDEDGGTHNPIPPDDATEEAVTAPSLAALPHEEVNAQKPAAPFSEALISRMPLVAQIAARKARIVELRALKDSLVDEEDFEGAQLVKQQIKEQETALEATRRGQHIRTLPSPSRGKGSCVAALPQDKASMSLGAQGAVQGDACQQPEEALDEAASAGQEQENTDLKLESASPEQAVEAEEDTSTDKQQLEDSDSRPVAIAQWCDSDTPGFVELCKPCEEELKQESSLPDFKLPRDIYDRLYPYQCDGVAWLARLWQRRQGGVLADEMGLGKTVQICALLNGARKAGASHALVLLPVTLLEQWSKEASIWCPGWPVHIYYGSAAQRAEALRNVSTPQGGLLLTSYSMLSNAELFQVAVQEPLASQIQKPSKGSKRKRIGDSANAGNHRLNFEVPPGELSKPGQTRAWDLVVCDEAHRMKNISSLFSKSLRRVSSRCRLLLTGTPVQNALQDLWALMDFAMPGLLGNHATFVKHFSDPIDRGSVRGASAFAVNLKNHLAGELRGRIAPYLLRRTKVSSGLVLEGTSSKDAQEDVALDEAIATLGSEFKALPQKRETIVWVMPSEEQVAVHQKVLQNSKIIQEASAKSKLGIEVFQAIGLMKRLSNHPLLVLPMPKPSDWKEVLVQATETLPETGEDKVELTEALPDVLPQAAVEGEQAVEVADDARAGRSAEMLVRKLPRDADSLLAQSAKLRCLALLLPSLASRGHRTLVFSQSAKMLDLVQICVLKPHGLRCLRIDGQTEPTARAEKVAKFQQQRDRFQCMLLTTSVGGVGLNLTSADRVVVLDPAWNPASDMQAVDRAYRIGQEKEVRTYRLITSGSIEDKMFRLQVFKMGLTKTALEGDQQHRYFTAKEIRALFEWTDPAEGETRKLLLNKLGPESEQPVLEAAREDGADEAGWLGDWIATGASDFGALMNGFAPEEEQQVESNASVADHIATAKQKLEAAEEQSRSAAEARLAVKEKLDASEERMEAAKALMQVAQTEVKAAADVLHEKSVQLAQARRAESLAQKQVDAMLSLKNQHQKVFEAAKTKYIQASMASAAFSKGGDKAESAARAAEHALSKAFADTEAVLRGVDENGQSLDPGCFDATPTKLKKAQMALERVRKNMDKVAICQAELEGAEEELVAREAAVEEAAEAAIQDGTAAVDGQPEHGSSEDGLSARTQALEEERELVREFHAKAQENAEAAREETSSAVAACVEAGIAFADSFVKTQLRHATQTQVKLAQAEARRAFKSLSPAWSALRKAQDIWLKSSALRKRATRQLTVATAPKVEAEVKFRTAEQWHADAVAEHAPKLEQLKACQAEVASAEAAKNQEDSKLTTLKKEYEDLKKEAADVKGALKPMRVAQKEAKVVKKAVMKEFARVERARQKVEEAKTSALKRLTSEQYVANQVERAYELKKKKGGKGNDGQDEEEGGGGGEPQPEAEDVKSEAPKVLRRCRVKTKEAPRAAASSPARRRGRPGRPTASSPGRGRGRPASSVASADAAPNGSPAKRQRLSLWSGSRSSAAGRRKN